MKNQGKKRTLRGRDPPQPVTVIKADGRVDIRPPSYFTPTDASRRRKAIVREQRPNDAQIPRALILYREGRMTVDQIVALTGISRTRLVRALAQQVDQ